MGMGMVRYVISGIRGDRGQARYRRDSGSRGRWGRHHGRQKQPPRLFRGAIAVSIDESYQGTVVGVSQGVL